MAAKSPLWRIAQDRELRRYLQTSPPLGEDGAPNPHRQIDYHLKARKGRATEPQYLTHGGQEGLGTPEGGAASPGRGGGGEQMKVCQKIEVGDADVAEGEEGERIH